MPFGVYSETFVRTANGNVYTQYTVPVARRAVVKCVVLANTTAAPVLTVCKVANFCAVYALIPAQSQLLFSSMMAVGYAGQVIETWAAADGVHQMVSGYLLDAPGALVRRHPEQVEVPAGPDAPFEPGTWS